MSKNKSIFLNTELISELPKRDFIATPEFFPRADVQPGAGFSPASSRPVGCTRLWLRWDQRQTQGKNSLFVQGTGGGPCPTKILGEGGS